MKVIAINGSARKDGNTSNLIKMVLEELNKGGIETELVELSGKNLRNCLACYKCFENKNRKCIIDNDILNEIIEKMANADAIILGSPTYFANVSPEIKSLIDRAGLVGIANDYLFARKAGAAVVAVRRAGSVNVFDAINKFFFINQMIVPGSVYWNMGIGSQPGDVNNDEEGVRTMKILGQNMSWLLKRIT
ncbi:MAG: flavodoxin family protein [Candidatus Fermentibacteraceae bacterium]|nr:flavodoxin family protein [Candidatus Fermentibacteraceae bacterium]